MKQPKSIRSIYCTQWAQEYLLRDRDAINGSQFQRRVKNMGIEEVITAPRSPWQNVYVERLIVSIRRDCLDHVIVLNERHLKQILTRYFEYYHRWRTHLSLEMDSCESRPVQPPVLGEVVQFPEVGGLHRHYERLAVSSYVTWICGKDNDWHTQTFAGPRPPGYAAGSRA